MVPASHFGIVSSCNNHCCP